MPRKLCLLCNTLFEVRTSSNLCSDCSTYTTNCESCGILFTRHVVLSRIKVHGFPRFCSRLCSGKARQLKTIPCPICGKQFKPNIVDIGGIRKVRCSHACASKARIGKPSKKRTPMHIRKAVKERYPTEGAELLADEFSLSIRAIQMIAYKEGVRLEPDIYKARVHESARQYMLLHNPMKNPDTVQKVMCFWREHPELSERHALRQAQTNSQMQKNHQSGLERTFLGILDSLGVQYESQVVIKPQFVADVRIGKLIIECDGDYWHGNPERFPELTERQAKQQRRDRARDKYLSTCGYTVVRIWESDMSSNYVISILKEHDILCT